METVRRRETREERFDREWRTRIAAMPLEKRQQLAEELRWRDGVPLTEADIRMNARQMRESGYGRDRIIGLLSVTEPGKRRIGSLNPEEVALIVAEVWKEGA